MSDRYRKLGAWVWTDSRLEDLPKPPANPHYLYQYLLTGPNAMALPGASRIGEAGIAEQLGWTIEEFRRCFGELKERGLAEADWDKRVIYVPDAYRDNSPVSKSVVTAWRKAFNELPGCELKAKLYLKAVSILETLHESFLKEFLEQIDPTFLKSAWAKDAAASIPASAADSISVSGSERPRSCDSGKATASNAGSVSPETEAGEEAGKGKEEKTDARRVPLRAFIFSEFEKVRGFKPFTDASDWTHFETLLLKTRDDPSYTLEKLCEYWARFAHSPDTFHRKQGKPLRFFCTNINAFMADLDGTDRKNGNGNGRPFERPGELVYVPDE